MSTSAHGLPQAIAVKDGPEALHMEIYSHGPQWQRRVRFELGTPARRVGHGSAFCSVEMVEILTRLFLACGSPVRIVDRSGPQPVFYRSTDKAPHPDEREAPRDE